MKSIYKYIIVFVSVVIVGVVFYNKIYLPKITYETTTATVGDIKVKVFGIGNVGAKSIYNISAGVSAKILSIDTDEGLWVKKANF